MLVEPPLPASEDPARAADRMLEQLAGGCARAGGGEQQARADQQRRRQKSARTPHPTSTVTRRFEKGRVH